MPNERFLNALQGKPQKIPPIWLMRQAGRYHSHYQNLKKSYTFEELCKSPKLAAETAMGPIEDFDFDEPDLFSKEEEDAPDDQYGDLADKYDDYSDLAAKYADFDDTEEGKS